MKRSGILNAELSEVLATLGHTDLLLVVDAGFPVPRDVHRIDLALAENLPDLRTVLGLIADELVVEGVVRAEDVPSHNPRLDAWLHESFVGAEFTTRPHTEVLGDLARDAKAVVRTGAFEPWGNIGLYCGVDAPRWFGGEGVVVPEQYASKV
ncbi:MULTISPECIES: D-ribose pyranase [Streptomyces]|uniref:D-ribose pyranase n=1 Tax=Streptomyces TaxID=1883 RepID=UPI000851BCD3|nr:MULTISPECIES: D-ribose pyranase [unclassified Streptomyces]MDQ0693755.1 D-ribose pyranase [Streptomyces sp. W4I9-2]MDX3485005.1 D-ribose pyranase [Streptomyces sp. ID05-18]